MHLFPLIKTRAQHRTKQRNRIPGSITVLVHRVHRAQKVLPCQGHQANVIEGALGCSTSSSYKSSASSSSSPSGKYVGNGRFLQWSLYAGSVESLTWGNKEKILTHKWYQLWYLKLPLIKKSVPVCLNRNATTPCRGEQWLYCCFSLYSIKLD